MKKQTQTVWKTAGWSLAAAGSLGLALAANAQSPYHPLSNRNPAAGSLENVPALDPNRELEIRTELAWLANPATFPYQLQAHVLGTMLEARGYLASEHSRAEALKIARDESTMPVKDSIRIYRSLAVVPTSKPASVLKREAGRVLAQALPRSSDSMVVSVWLQGQIVLQGAVPTLEDKLKASRCLQQVPGCSCVVNQLEVEKSAPAKPTNTVIAQGPDRQGNPMAPTAPAKPMDIAVALDERPGKSTIPVDVRKSAPAMPMSTVLAPEERPEKSTIPVLESGLKLEHVTVLPAQSIAVDLPEQKAAPDAATAPGGGFADGLILLGDESPSPEKRPASPYAHAEVSPTAVDKQPSSPYMYHPTAWRKLNAENPSSPARSTPFAVGNHALPHASAAASAAGDGTIFFDDTETPVAAKPEPAVPHLVIQEGSEREKIVLLAPPSLSVFSVSSTQKEAPVQDPWTVRQTNSMPSTAAAQVPLPVATAAPAPQDTGIVRQTNSMPSTAAAQVHLPVETPVPAPQGISLPGNPPTPQQHLVQNNNELRPPNFNSPTLQKHLQGLVAVACKKPLRDVEVAVLAESKVEVRIKAHSSQECEELSRCIFQIPELGPFQVSLDIPVQ